MIRTTTTMAWTTMEMVIVNGFFVLVWDPPDSISWSNTFLDLPSPQIDFFFQVPNFLSTQIRG
jgi:hypothetical protein